eukprot:TRINITY_DN14183_c0_g1_i1.p1 TRINITY_DN14183_c0_g1~~TRINITY_DN14183_c0_g1_i1.p1  ORF type:complete len:128 (+),score=28.47 TRINITY_DN14183_c0_g1_i1:25-408(+)
MLLRASTRPFQAQRLALAVQTRQPSFFVNRAQPVSLLHKRVPFINASLVPNTGANLVALVKPATLCNVTAITDVSTQTSSIIPLKQGVDRFTMDSVKRKRKKKIKKHLYKKRMRRMKALMRRLGKIR